MPTPIAARLEAAPPTEAERAATWLAELHTMIAVHIPAYAERLEAGCPALKGLAREVERIVSDAASDVGFYRDIAATRVATAPEPGTVIVLRGRMTDDEAA